MALNGPAGVAASECAPQPWSSDTTLPSSGAYSFAQTPKTRPSGLPSRTRNPQVAQGAGAACASGVRGPCSLAYQRTAVASRPIAESTRARAGAGPASRRLAAASAATAPAGSGLADSGLADSGLADSGLADSGLAGSALAGLRLAGSTLGDLRLAGSALADLMPAAAEGSV